jgi:hypothetical protein
MARGCLQLGTWVRYRIGFSFLMGTAVLYGHALYRTVYPNSYPFYWLVYVALLLILLDSAIRSYILLSYPYQVNPYEAVGKKPRTPRRKNKALSQKNE